MARAYRAVGAKPRCGHGARTGNATTEIMDYESDIFAVKDHEEGEHHFSLAFKDTVGLGADDIPCEEVFIQTFTKLLHNVEAVNGFILVLKMTPITEAFAQTLRISNSCGT